MRLGVCYYPEHWPESLWKRDAEEMRSLGISMVRIGEFAWSRIEPAAGYFYWGWLDRAIATLAAAGLEVVLGTPTATPPRWLVHKYPEILAVDAQGRPRGFGSRRHYCFSSPTYRREAARITDALARNYGGHPAVRGWQIDNEYGCHDTVISYSPAAASAFRQWLRAKYGDVQTLNQAWGNVFWSMDYPGFEAIDPPAGTVTEPNPAQVLDWRRFSSDQVVRFNAAQARIIRRYAPDAFITHNFMGFFTDFDARAVAADLDVATWDSYPLGFLDSFDFPDADKRRWCRTGHPDIAAFHHDLYRGIGCRRFSVMEQQPGPVNWAAHNPAPLAGMIALWTLEALAHGADFVSYFRWRQCPFAQEQMHTGLKCPDDAPDVGYGEVAALAPVLGRLPDSPSQRAPVALVFDYESEWLIQTQPQGRRFQHRALAFAFYGALRGLGLDIDIVGADDSLDAYQLVVVPCLPMLTDARMARFAAAPGQIVFGPRSGSKTVDFGIPPELPPGPLGRHMALRIPRVESLPDGVHVEVSGLQLRGAMTHWREYPQAGCEVLASTSDGVPAVLAAGRLRYVAGWPDPALLHTLMRRCAAKVGLAVTELPRGLRLRRHAGCTFAFNFGPDTALAPTSDSARFIHGSARLKPGDVAIWQE